MPRVKEPPLCLCGSLFLTGGVALTSPSVRKEGVGALIGPLSFGVSSLEKSLLFRIGAYSIDADSAAVNCC